MFLSLKSTHLSSHLSTVSLIWPKKNQSAVCVKTKTLLTELVFTTESLFMHNVPVMNLTSPQKSPHISKAEFLHTVTPHRIQTMSLAKSSPSPHGLSLQEPTTGSLFSALSLQNKTYFRKLFSRPTGSDPPGSTKFRDDLHCRWSTWIPTTFHRGFLVVKALEKKKIGARWWRPRLSEHSARTRVQAPGAHLLGESVPSGEAGPQGSVSSPMSPPLSISVSTD